MGTLGCGTPGCGGGGLARLLVTTGRLAVTAPGWGEAAPGLTGTGLTGTWLTGTGLTERGLTIGGTRLAVPTIGLLVAA